ncbi:MAG: hypothetical protein U9N48_00815 [Euryarchaeota archaeon]|nr:hypothetical protein [Euryarchaeota archaeon]
MELVLGGVCCRGGAIHRAAGPEYRWTSGGGDVGGAFTGYKARRECRRSDGLVG